MNRTRRASAAARGAAMAVGAVLVTIAMVGTAGAAPCDPVDEMVYVALGDSYSSGFGQSDATGDCNRSNTKNFPKIVRNEAGIGALVDVSCSGARTTHFAGTQGSNPPQLDALNEYTDIVTFSIGGNDLGFTDILTNCATDGDCRGDYGGNGMPDLHADIQGEVGDRVEAAMRAVIARAPNAQIFTIGYPDLLPAGPSGFSWGLSCLPISALISEGERNSLRGVQQALNEEIAERAAIVGGPVHYVDVYTPSIGHDMCSSSPWVTQLANLFHPSDLGHREIGKLIAAQIPGALDAACQNVPVTTTTTEATTTTESTIPHTTNPPWTQPSTTLSPGGPATTLPPETIPPRTVPPTTAPPTTVAPPVSHGQDGDSAPVVSPARQDGQDGDSAGPGGSGSAGSAGGSSDLSRTGADPMPLTTAGVSLLLGGLVLTIRSSRVARRTA